MRGFPPMKNPIPLTNKTMDKNKIVELLKTTEDSYNQEDIEKFAAYCVRLKNELKDGVKKNPWMQSKSEEQMAELFRRVAKDGLVFDGEHITLQKTGISYSYVAYKNKMLLAYPESQIDVSLVYTGDDFSFTKDSGKVCYKHNIIDPFGQKDSDVVGGYCVIKNKRGEFLTLLGKEDIEKHRKVAKTDFFWKQWYKEMCLKTVIKKACGQHFKDIYRNIEANDNENYDLENPIGLELKHKQAIDAINSEEELTAYYNKNKGAGKDFDKAIAKRRAQLTQTA